VIDLLAFHEVSRSLLVVELKTAIVDVNDLLATMDRRRRLAPRIASERGWNVGQVSAWVLVEDSATNRRRLAAHATLLRGAFPVDGRGMRRFLSKPGGGIAALSFLSLDAVSGTSTRLGPVRRVAPGSCRTEPMPKSRSCLAHRTGAREVGAEGEPAPLTTASARNVAP
jgi:hypothetical protein